MGLDSKDDSFRRYGFKEPFNNCESRTLDKSASCVDPKSTTFFVESLQGTGSLLQLSAAPAQENQHLKRYTSLLQPLNVTTAGVQDTLFAHHQLLY